MVRTLIYRQMMTRRRPLPERAFSDGNRFRRVDPHERRLNATGWGDQARLETYLEGLPHVGIVIHYKNIRLIHGAAYRALGKQTDSVRTLILTLSASFGCPS